MKNTDPGLNKPEIVEIKSFEPIMAEQFSMKFAEEHRALKLKETAEKITLGVVFDTARPAFWSPHGKDFWKRFFPGQEVEILPVEQDEFSSFLCCSIPGKKEWAAETSDGSETPDSSGYSDGSGYGNPGESIYTGEDNHRQGTVLPASPSAQVPAVNLVNGWLIEGIRRGASDIHVEEGEGETRIRYRQDGVLVNGGTVSSRRSEAAVNRIKFLSGMNLLENRQPQEGRFSISLGGEKRDIRVSVLPAHRGQSTVLRLLGEGLNLRSLNELGFCPEVTLGIRNLLARPGGLLAVCGPTGSGKTTTLNSLLAELPGESLKILSIEDPVEYRIPDISQVQVNQAAGLTFSSLLKRVLRQDPDVLLIGEIRDSETAALAVRAAMTGHLVLTSLHSKDALSVPRRLVNLDVPGYMAAAVLKGVISQRLVRKLCPVCREPAGEEWAFRPRGCSRCGNTGYLGRTAVGELLLPGSSPGGTLQDWESCWKDSWKNSLVAEGLGLVSRGLTSREELSRVGIL